ncbi:ENTP8 diphosphohydrolase, partial [Phaetusa simplex]|nr:ENTP8 diphosphohydrolase [Phaetusa simplex]
PCPLCFPQYGLVFDAGSTHTALYIYWWPADKENGTGIVSQVAACTVSGECARTCPSRPPESLSQALTAFLSLLAPLRKLPSHCLLQRTPFISFPGREQNSTKAEQVFAEVAKAIGEYPVDFRGAQILTGNEEGSLGWITVNYLLETLVKRSFTGEWTHPPAEDVVGALDLGGASTQITFLPGTTIDDSNTRALLRLYGTNYSVYTHSYLCYGQKQALKMLMASLHQVSASSLISHPCYPKGYQENVTTADLYSTPCVQAPSRAGPAQVLRVTGTGNPAECRTAIQKLFNFSCGANRTCGFNGVYQPPVRGQFFAFSGLYHNLRFLNLTGGQSLSSVDATVEQFCNSSWEKVQKEFPTMNRTQLRDACAASSYTLTLLLQGYKFNHTTWLNIHFVRQVSNVDVGWTLGYMLNLTNMIPLETPPRVIGLQRTNWIAATVLLAIMLILIFCLLTAMCYQKNSFGYESL